MSQSLALVLVHIIFSTKNRMPFLQSAELRSEVHAYLPLRGLECDPLQVGGVEDHVHILCGLSRKISLAELQDLKQDNRKGKDDAFSGKAATVLVSQSARGSVFSYIAKQEIHHRKINFQDEFRVLLNKHEFVLRSNMCEIDPGELTPFQGGSVYWTVPGVETPG